MILTWKDLTLMLWVDKNVGDLLAKNKITMYSTENEEKSAVCEGWNRTIKDKVYKSTAYINILPKIRSSYNNSKHRSIGMTPVAARRPQTMAPFILIYMVIRIGDRVRISKCKRKTFDKGYTPNWTEDVFLIDEIQWTNPY